MSVQAMSWVIEHSGHKGNAFVVLLMIANHAKDDGSGAWPSIATLARKARIGERTVQRTIARLVRSKELSMQVGKGPSGTNLYTVNLTGAKLTPVKVTPVPHNDTGGVSNDAGGGVLALSPEPSLKQPSSNRPKVSRATRIPEDFIPQPEHYDLAKQLGINCEMEYQRFRDYFLGLSGPKAVKLDWSATLRNWLRNSLNYKPMNGGNGDNHKTATQLRNERSASALERAFSETTTAQDVPTALFKGTH